MSKNYKRDSDKLSDINKRASISDSSKRESYRGASIVKPSLIGNLKASLAKLLDKSLVKSLNVQKETKVKLEQKKNIVQEIKKDRPINLDNSTKSKDRSLQKPVSNLTMVTKSRDESKKLKNISVNLSKKKSKNRKNRLDMKEFKKMESMISVFKLLYGEKIANLFSTELLKAFKGASDPSLSKNERRKCRKIWKILCKKMSEKIGQASRSPNQANSMSEKKMASSEIFKPSATPYRANIGNNRQK